MIAINDYLSYIKSTDEPLSADVYMIKGSSFSYFVDVGSNKESMEIIENHNPKKIIITHFHEDHTGNLREIAPKADGVFLGDYSYKYFMLGSLVNERVRISDGVDLIISPLPSSHAKGSLCVAINEDILLVGDGYYCSSKGYNVSLLYDEIRCLEELKYNRVIMSHDEKIYSKEEVLSSLKEIYSKREKNNPFINI